MSSINYLENHRIQMFQLGIIGYPDYTLNDRFEIISRRTRNPKKLSAKANRSGYPLVSMYDYENKQNQVRLSTIVAKLYLGDPKEALRYELNWNPLDYYHPDPRMTVLHRDGDYENVDPHNLMWSTRDQAIKHHKEQQDPYVWDTADYMNNIIVNPNRPGKWYGIREVCIATGTNYGRVWAHLTERMPLPGRYRHEMFYVTSDMF